MTTTRNGSGRRIGFSAVLVLAALATGCASDSESNSDAGAKTAGDEVSEVVMRLVAFKPGELEVKAGTTVTWRNQDVGAHTVTSGTVEQGGAGVTKQPDGTFDSGNVSKGQTFEQAFDEPGTYPYFCSLHPATMRGEIRVL